VDILTIREKILDRRYAISFSHTEKMRLRKIALDEIEDAILNGEIIEPYPEDPRGPSCLIFGYSHQNRPLHVLCGNLSGKELLIITAYEPDRKEWEIDLKTRKKGG
jgi:hypothetical protein